MTRLAAYLADFECFQTELSKNYGVVEWRDDLKRLMQAAGMENKPMVFLFSDTQIKNESFLEGINSILNSGDVPGIYVVGPVTSNVIPRRSRLRRSKESTWEAPNAASRRRATMRSDRSTTPEDT